MSSGLAGKKAKKRVKRGHASAEPTLSLSRNPENHFSKFRVLTP